MLKYLFLNTFIVSKYKYAIEYRIAFEIGGLFELIEQNYKGQIDYKNGYLLLLLNERD